MRRWTALLLLLGASVRARPVCAESEPLPPPPIVISAPRADVWAALTTVEGLSTRDGGQVTVDLRPGGAIRRHADARAAADAAGWTTTAVLAFVAPRLLVLGGDTPSAWTSIELDALDRLRTRVRFEHVGIAPGSKADARADADDAASVARLRKRFPNRPDPVVTALTPLVGTWEERSEQGGPVLARWTIAVDPGDEPEARAARPEGLPASASLTRKPTGDGGADRWVFWREAASGRWIGGLVGGGRPWEIDPYECGGIGWSDRFGELGGVTYSMEHPPAGGEVAVVRIDGCIGNGFRWTPVAEPK